VSKNNAYKKKQRGKTLIQNESRISLFLIWKCYVKLIKCILINIIVLL
jgi:hypothetical protein